MSKTKESVERALRDLNDMKNHEADYGIINKYLNIINTFATLGHVCDAMAKDLAEKTGKTPEAVMDEYYGKV